MPPRPDVFKMCKELQLRFDIKELANHGPNAVRLIV